MSISTISSIKGKLIFPTKATTLNPNAAEFVPSSLRSSVHGVSDTSSRTKLDAPDSVEGAVTGKVEHPISNHSDEEAHQFWKNRLPDDITPDFKDTVEDLSFTGLSVTNQSIPSSASPRLASNIQRRMMHFNEDDRLWREAVGYPNPLYPSDLSPSLGTSSGGSWQNSMAVGERFLENSKLADHYVTDTGSGLANSVLSASVLAEDAASNAVKLLLLKFPNVSPFVLAEVFRRNGSDLAVSSEILAQLENKSGNHSNQRLRSKSFGSSSLPMSRHAVSADFTQSAFRELYEEEKKQSDSAYRSVLSFPAEDKVLNAAVQDFTLFDASQRVRPTRDDSSIFNSGSSRISQLSARYNGNSDVLSNDMLKNVGASEVPPIWPNNNVLMRTASNDEFHRSRLQNTFLEQGRHSFLGGSDALTSEQTSKRQMHDARIKAIQDKPREFLSHQRNMRLEHLGYGRETDAQIDLRGLRETEAIRVLDYQINSLKRGSRSSGQWLRAVILTGIGDRNAERLSMLAEQYLSEHGLRFQLRAGVLLVIVE